MSLIGIEQGTDAWRQARCGSLGASRVADAIARIKSGWGASRSNLMAELLVERLTGVPTVGYQNETMKWGQEKEPEAIAAYEFRTEYEVLRIGIAQHPTIAGAHASPDGLVGDDGLVEVKCPQSATHLDILLGEPIPAKYITQMQWQMSTTGRRWCDWVSYDPRLPETMRLFIQRIPRNDARIAELEGMVSQFLAELDNKIVLLKERYESTVLAA